LQPQSGQCLLDSLPQLAVEGVAEVLRMRMRFRAAMKAAAYHLAATLVVAVLSAGIVFGVWYPFPYREMAGGTNLFLILVAVDLVCGPLLTLVLFDPNKSRRELSLDISLVVLLQLGALGYGLYSVAQARPVYLVFEVDRFRMVSVADIQPEKLRPELGGLQILPWSGPKVIGVRSPVDPEEKIKSLELSLQGIEPSARPDWWQDYELTKQQVIQKAQSVESLRSRQPEAIDLINEAVKASGKSKAEIGWLPITSFKSTDWVVFVDLKSAKLLAYAPVDGF
jgi:hypothetical protein